MERSFIKNIARDIAGFIPLSIRMGKSYWDLRKFLAEAQYWSFNKIQDWQLARLKKIVDYAYNHTAGYHQLYDEAGISPRDLQTLSDIRHFPFVHKKLLQENVKDFTVQSVRADYCSTGGSSGIPFSFYQTRHLQKVVEQAFMHTGWSWVGWKMGMRSAAIRGAFVGTEEHYKEYDRLYKELHLSSYYLNEASVKKYLSTINHYNCDVIHAYPSQYYMLCDLIGEHIGHNPPITAHYAFMGSENVYDWQIARCQEVFPDIKIFTWYGHTEKAILAPWCEYSQIYHIWPFYGFCEVLDYNNKPASCGEEGELVGTSFYGLATPFIRYRTEDRAVMGANKCPHCGRNFQLLEKIVGRNHEVVVSKSGRYISMTAIAGSIHGDIFEKILQFQFQQIHQGKVTFQFIAKPYATVDHANLYENLHRIFGEDVELTVKEVATIPRTKLGKYSYLDQRLNIRYGADNVSV